MQVAVADCTRAVTPSPAALHAGGQHLAQAAAVDAQHAGAHDARAPQEQRDGRQQVQKVQHVTTAG